MRTTPVSNSTTEGMSAQTGGITGKSLAAALVRSGELLESFHHATLGVFNITSMREHCRRARARGAEPYLCAFEDVSAENGHPDPMAFLVGNREVDMDRVAELTREDLEDPVIMVACPPGVNGSSETHLLVDGIHRLVARHDRGYKDFVLWMIPWDEAQVHRVRPDEGLMSVSWGTKEVVDGQLVDRARRSGTPSDSLAHSRK